MDVKQEAIQLGQKYGLLVALSSPALPAFPVTIPHGQISGEEADHQNVESYWPRFRAEWELYPSGFVKQTKLKRIILCENLAFENQLRTAIPDFEHHDLYIDVSRGHDNQLYVREVIHHEFFHIIDYCLDHLTRDDDEWTDLNPRGFMYGGGGQFYQNRSGTSVFSNNYPGFINEYSTSGLAEDKAEIFANMVVNRTGLSIFNGDNIVQKKMKKMKELLKRFYPQLTQLGGISYP